MPTVRKPKTTLKTFSAAQIAAAKAAAAAASVPSATDDTDWARGVVTPGGGVAATIGALRKARGKNKNPTKEQVAIRLDPEVLAAFRAKGPGWQTRMNTALKEWLVAHPPAPRRRSVAHAET
jgi:uncharacterized protein (DUF4415 family)